MVGYIYSSLCKDCKNKYTDDMILEDCCKDCQDIIADVIIKLIVSKGV